MFMQYSILDIYIHPLVAGWMFVPLCGTDTHEDEP